MSQFKLVSSAHQKGPTGQKTEAAQDGVKPTHDRVTDKDQCPLAYGGTHLQMARQLGKLAPRYFCTPKREEAINRAVLAS